MAKFIVEVSHTDRECVWALQQMLQHSTEALERFEWGCRDGVHVGWTVVEAEHKFAPQALVPQILRPTARIIELCVFTPDEIRALHEGRLQAEAELARDV